MDPTVLITLLELAANTILSVLGAKGVVGSNIGSFVSAIESAVAPLIAVLTSGGATKTADVMAAYGTIIGVLNVLKQSGALPAAEITKIDEYILAAQNGTSGYITASLGFNASNLTPVLPMPSTPAS